MELLEKFKNQHLEQVKLWNEIIQAPQDFVYQNYYYQVSLSEPIPTNKNSDRKKDKISLFLNGSMIRIDELEPQVQEQFFIQFLNQYAPVSFEYKDCFKYYRGLFNLLMNDVPNLFVSNTSSFIQYVQNKNDEINDNKEIDNKIINRALEYAFIVTLGESLKETKTSLVWGNQVKKLILKDKFIPLQEIILRHKGITMLGLKDLIEFVQRQADCRILQKISEELNQNEVKDFKTIKL